MPRQPFLIEGYDNLGALDIGFLGRDQVSLIRVFPVNHESRLAVRPRVTIEGLCHLKDFTPG